jgi:hypothetical protein
MLLKSKFFVLGMLFSLCASVAFAQTHSSSHVKKVETLLEVVHFDEMMEKNIDLVVNNLTQDPSFASHKKEFKTLFTEIVDYESSKKRMMNAYLNAFTEAEIDEMIKFNQSPLGQKMLKKLPELSQQLMANMQDNVQSNRGKIQDLFVKIALENSKNQK